jgi:hypothetical protein
MVPVEQNFAKGAMPVMAATGVMGRKVVMEAF